MAGLNFFSNIFKKDPQIRISSAEKLKRGAAETVERYNNVGGDVDHKLLTAIREARNKYVSSNELVRQKDGATKTILEMLSEKFPDYEKPYINCLWEALDKKEKELIDEEK